MIQTEIVQRCQVSSESFRDEGSNGNSQTVYCTYNIPFIMLCKFIQPHPGFLFACQKHD